MSSGVKNLAVLILLLANAVGPGRGSPVATGDRTS